MHGAFVGAIRDVNRAAPCAQEMTGGEFAHLACADDEDGLVLEAAKDLLSHLNGSVSNRDRGAAQRGLPPHPLCYRQGLAHHFLERAGQSPGFVRQLKGPLQLSEDLRFAQNHRIETGSHTE